MTATVKNGQKFKKDLRNRGFVFDTGKLEWRATDLEPMNQFGKDGYGTPRKGFLFSKAQLSEWGGTIK